ncbi:MAG: hypothetical protein FWG70_06190 [Oscillospiraceae bacterium]|nr:hypothetical protein [Oscillospiraceae bacterium]
MKNEEGATNCIACGAKLVAYTPPVQRHHTHPAQLMWTLKTKKNYVLNLACSARYGGSVDFDIIANLINQGKLKSGKTLTVTVDEPIVELLIKGWGINPLKTKMKLGENAYAEVGIWKKNIIFYGVSGAEIV